MDNTHTPPTCTELKPRCLFPDWEMKTSVWEKNKKEKWRI
jgi:hypothetical protein